MGGTEAALERQDAEYEGCLRSKEEPLTFGEYMEKHPRNGNSSGHRDLGDSGCV